MRRAAALGIAIAIAACASRARAWDQSSPPEQGWTFTSFRLVYGYTDGMRQGTIGGTIVGVPYRDHAGAFEFEIEHYDARRPGQSSYPDIAGIALGLRFWARVGAVAVREWESPPGVAAEPLRSWAEPVRIALGAGTLAQIVRVPDFVLAAHASLEFHMARASWTPDVAFAIYPGLRMIWQPSPLRIQIGYDFVPFIGEPRIEHRATAAVAFQLGSVGLGVRFLGALGQVQTPQGGLDDTTLGGALELVL